MVCLVGVKTNSFLFIKVDRVIVTQVGFCVIYQWLLSGLLSNHKKALLRLLLHLHRNVHRIPTKLGTEIRCNEPFKCTKFQPDWSTHSCFMVDFAKCAERSRKDKNEEENVTLAACFSIMSGAIVFKFGI